MFLDVSDDIVYGRKMTDLAAEFIESTASDSPGRVLVCPIQSASTLKETTYVRNCLEQQHARSAILVTSDFHTRRAFSTFRGRLPQYEWSVAAATTATHSGRNGGCILNGRRHYSGASVPCNCHSARGGGALWNTPPITPEFFLTTVPASIISPGAALPGCTRNRHCPVGREQLN